MPSLESLERERDVCSRTTLSRSTLWAKVADGTFPPPVRLGRNRVAWPTSVVSRWIADKIAEAT